MSSVLEIMHVSAAEAGPYTCRASNSHGADSQTYTVVVLGKLINTIKSDQLSPNSMNKKFFKQSMQ